MKKQKLFFYRSGRGLFHLLIFIWWGMTSCSDQIEYSSSSACISFRPSIGHAWSPVTRGSADILSGTVTSLQTEDGNNIYLHTFITDSIVSRFSVTNGKDTPVTRAVPINNSERMYNSFGVSAYSYTGSWDGNQRPDFMYDIPVTESGGFWLPSSDYYWPGAAYKIRFFAYAPKGDRAYQLAEQTAGEPNITCVIPADVTNQKDLLVAVSGELDGNANSTVNLAFQHALTAVRFICGNDIRQGEIKSVTLENVYSGGTYNMETGEWNEVRGKTSFSQFLERQINGTAGDTITTESQTFMMIPQILPDDAAVKIVFDDGTQEHTLKAGLKNGVWPKGKTVTYQISTSSINWEYTLKITSPADFLYAGGTNQYKIASYRRNTAGSMEPVAWEARFSTDGGTTWESAKPAWITSFTEKGDGGSTETSYKVTVSPQAGVNESSGTLRNAIPKGSSSAPYNLANGNGTPGIVENTANCYVVNAPGLYSFPLVYGNAIKNGTFNRSAYISGIADASQVLHCFINHKGNELTSPYINQNAGCVAAKAELVWQDVLNLVTDIRLTGNGESAYVSFKVDKETIQQGNAVIAVKDADDVVLWSWHIWVTDTDINQTKKTKTRLPSRNDEYDFMVVNLGWCDEGTTTYAERTCLVKIIPSIGQSQTFSITQQAASLVYGGNSPYYQWGRKDPFLPSNGRERNANKTWYNAENVPSTETPSGITFPTGKVGISRCIQNPGVWNNKEVMDCAYFNLWDADSRGEEDRNIPVKTIYDPSPVGFQVAPYHAFTCFTKNGLNVDGEKNDIVGVWFPDKKLWAFQCNDLNREYFILFFVTGCRHCVKGGLTVTEEQGRSWSAWSGESVSHAIFFLFSGDGVFPQYGSNRAFGNPVRPVKEKE